MRITGVKQITASTTAQDVSVGYRDFLISNGGTVAVYIKEKDGVACTSSNGFFIPAGSIVPVKLAADTLSVIAASDTAVVSFLFMDV